MRGKGEVKALRSVAFCSLQFSGRRGGTREGCREPAPARMEGEDKRYPTSWGERLRRFSTREGVVSR